MEEILRENGFAEQLPIANGVRWFLKHNVEVLFNKRLNGYIAYTPKIYYSNGSFMTTELVDNIDTIEDLNRLLNKFRPKHKGQSIFIENLVYQN